MNLLKLEKDINMRNRNFGLMLATYVVGAVMCVATFFISIGLLILIC